MEIEKETEELMQGIKTENLIDVLKWNEDGRIWGKRKIDDINKIIVHQSLSDGKIENINKYLINKGNHISPEKGCPHICYHLAIAKNGSILILNNFSDITWHTKKQNRSGLAICVLGNFIGTGWNKGSEPTEEQLNSLENLIEYLTDKLNLGKNIYGHYHFGKPACPGKSCSEIVEMFRNDKRADIKANLFNRLDSVKDIQEALLILNHNSLPIYGADGILGEETKKAIVEFQILTNIPITGIADENTRTKLLIEISERGL